MAWPVIQSEAGEARYVSLAGDVVERITTENLLDQFAGDGLERDGDGLAIADDAIGPDQMDPDSATEGQVMMIGSGGAPEWQFPFEFPRTRLPTDLWFQVVFLRRRCQAQ